MMSFFSAINAERKDERTTNRPSFLSAIDAERKEERTTNRPSFFLQSMQKERTSIQQGEPQHRQNLTNLGINIGLKAKIYLECF